MSDPKLRILCLHGFTQSGPLFRAKTRALEKNLAKHFPSSPKPGSLPSYPGGVELYYPTAPVRLSAAQLPGFDVDGPSTEEDAWAWWRRRDLDGGKVTYDGLPEALSFLAEEMNTHGPFDGILGFSQGACATIMLASSLEAGRAEKFAAEKGMKFPAAELGEVKPVRFAVSYSGFRAPGGSGMDSFYDGGVETPTLHVIGSVDTVVSEERSLDLLEACRADGKEGRHKVVYHPGGHFVPSSQKPAVDALVGFIRYVVGGAERKKDTEQEESVEDMDVPF